MRSACTSRSTTSAPATRRSPTSSGCPRTPSKLDRSFVSGLPADRDDAAITQAVIALSHSLAMQVVAEGVETDAQLDFLRRAGCDQAQGYTIGRPMPAEQLAQRLHANLNLLGQAA